jgi:SAM-dependent methyltransferase
MSGADDEIRAITDRYARRHRPADSRLYDPLDPYVTRVRQERERALIQCIQQAGLAPVGGRRVLEVGCGGGANLLDLIRLGFRPENLIGNELRQERLDEAAAILPQSITLLTGDAATLDLPEESFDVVLQSTVFTSILDSAFQDRLASRMWSLVRPGGGVLWYDFTYDNPRNRDVRGVSRGRIRRLFPAAEIIHIRPVTLAPPLGRRLCQITPLLYPIFNFLPLLRTHLLCWIQKLGAR